ncbi:hypothetical protein BGZ57DRAFT_915169, partial [Hyaloscypha finlandica]
MFLLAMLLTCAKTSSFIGVIVSITSSMIVESRLERWSWCCLDAHGGRRVELGYDPEFTWNISNIGNIGNNTQLLKFGVWGIYIECFMRIFVNMQWSR